MRPARSREPGSVEIRVVGQPGDVAEVARLLRCSGLQVLGQSRQRPASSGGVRVYVDGRVTASSHPLERS